jgi:hypothetical protein
MDIVKLAYLREQMRKEKELSDEKREEFFQISKRLIHNYTQYLSAGCGHIVSIDLKGVWHWSESIVEYGSPEYEEALMKKQFMHPVLFVIGKDNRYWSPPLTDAWSEMGHKNQENLKRIIQETRVPITKSVLIKYREKYKNYILSPKLKSMILKKIEDAMEGHFSMDMDLEEVT